MACKRSGVRIPVAPLIFPDLCSIISDYLSDYGIGLLACVGFSRVLGAEDVIHDGCPAANGGNNDVPVDGLGDVRGLVANCVSDVLDGDARCCS
jgi:hypothetical protein